MTHAMSVDTFPLHPVATLIPEMTPEEFEDLKADIRAHGQREPIITLGDLILDGRHRYRAVEELGYDPVFKAYHGDTDEASLVAFVLSQNLHRRHLTESQRAMIADRIAPHGVGRPSKKITDKSAISQTRAAQLLKVSPDSVQNARKVHQHGAKALQRAVEHGEIAVTTAALLADAPKSAQNQIVARGEKEITRFAKEIKERNRRERVAQRQNDLQVAAASFTLEWVAPTPTTTIFNRDARELAEFVPHDVDLVFTSPPYNVGMPYHTHDDRLEPQTYRQLLHDVFSQCFVVMSDGARIGVNVPFGKNRDPYEPFAPLVWDILCAIGFTPVGQTIWDKGHATIANSTAWGSHCSASAPRFRDRCEAILWAYKTSPKLKLPKGAVALTDSDSYAVLSQDYWYAPPASSRHHPAVFSKELAENAIRFWCYRGAHVLDPFMGLGATLEAANALGCRATGVEIDAAYCAFAQKRLEITE